MSMIKRSPSTGPGSAEVIGVYEAASGSIQYLVGDPVSRRCALIDVVADFDPQAARIRHDAAQAMLDLVAAEGWQVEHILDTHPHADHLMASAWLKRKLGAPTAIGEKVREIADLWEGLYHSPGAFDPDRDFDRLLADGETFTIGDLPVRVMLSPGHTLGSISYVVGEDAVFAHDTFMQPDVGTSRCDFPGGSASVLWDSLQAILALGDHVRIFVGHDYGAEGREGPAWESTVAEQKARNPHLAGRTREDYVALREARDATLTLPDRMLFALQYNLRGGRLPPAEADGNSYFKIPANRF